MSFPELRMEFRSPRMVVVMLFTTAPIDRLTRTITTGLLLLIEVVARSKFDEIGLRRVGRQPRLEDILQYDTSTLNRLDINAKFRMFFRSQELSAVIYPSRRPLFIHSFSSFGRSGFRLFKEFSSLHYTLCNYIKYPTYMFQVN